MFSPGRISWRLSSACERVSRSPDFRYLLVDHSEIPEESVDTASLETLAHRSIESVSLVAQVAPGDILFGLSRMWETMAEAPGLDTRVTRNGDEAVGWLAVQLGRSGLPFRLTE